MNANGTGATSPTLNLEASAIAFALLLPANRGGFVPPYQARQSVEMIRKYAGAQE